MKKETPVTFAEILSQPAVWQATLGEIARSRDAIEEQWSALKPAQVVFTGCGSTYYLAQLAATLFQSLTGVPSCAFPGSEIVFFAPRLILDPQNTLLVTISRSGTTTETIQAIQRFKEMGGKAVWGISCYADTPQAALSDLFLLAEEAQETGLAQTRSFSSMVLLAQALAATVAGEDISPLQLLPDLGQELIDRVLPLAEELINTSTIERIFYLGSGYQHPTACEAVLKMKEMSLSHSEPFHFLEFRHGPMSLIDPQTLVVGLLSADVTAPEEQVLSEMAEMGAQVLALTPTATTIPKAWPIAVDQHLPSWVLPILYLPPVQLLAYFRTVSKGLDPDNPRHLKAVIALDPETLSVGI